MDEARGLKRVALYCFLAGLILGIASGVLGIEWYLSAVAGLILGIWVSRRVLAEQRRAR